MKPALPLSEEKEHRLIRGIHISTINHCDRGEDGPGGMMESVGADWKSFEPTGTRTVTYISNGRRGSNGVESAAVHLSSRRGKNQENCRTGKNG